MSFRRSALRDVGGFDGRYWTNAEDLDLGLRLTQSGHTLRYLPEAKVYHQRTDDAESLERTMRAWYSNGYLARKRNHSSAWQMVVGSARRLVTYPIADLLIHRDPGLARLSWRLGWAKLVAIWATKRSS
jgi:GT2 family glycosyltransferase